MNVIPFDGSKRSQDDVESVRDGFDGAGYSKADIDTIT
jgi:hypothetical protein